MNMHTSGLCLTKAARPAGFAATAPSATPSREYSCTVPLLPHIMTMSPTCQQHIAGDHSMYNLVTTHDRLPKHAQLWYLCSEC
jgi:hypothetical protein